MVMATYQLTAGGATDTSGFLTTMWVDGVEAPQTRVGKLAVCGFAVLALEGVADVISAVKDLWTGSAVCKAKAD